LDSNVGYGWPGTDEGSPYVLAQVPFDMLVDAPAHVMRPASGRHGTLRPSPDQQGPADSISRAVPSDIAALAPSSGVHSTREIVQSLLPRARDVSPTTSSIIRANRHLQHLDISPAFRLALDQLVQTLECSGLHEANRLPLCTDSILAFDVFHQAEYRVLYCA
jgi:hypothetical protein